MFDVKKSNSVKKVLAVIQWRLKGGRGGRRGLWYWGKGLAEHRRGILARHKGEHTDQ